MSEQQIETPPEGDPQPEQPATDTTDWKSEARKWEARAKANTDAAKRLEEIENQSKSELQKAAERAEAAERRVQEFETAQQVKQWKDEVAEATGVPAAALSGSTLEDITAHAEVLAPLIKAAQKGPRVPNVGDTPQSPAVDEKQQFLRDLFKRDTA